MSHMCTHRKPLGQLVGQQGHQLVKPLELWLDEDLAVTDGVHPPSHVAQVSLNDNDPVIFEEGGCQGGTRAESLCQL